MRPRGKIGPHTNPRVRSGPPRDHKTCTICRHVLPLTAFYANTKTRDGRGARCVPCEGQYSRAYNERNKERLSARAKAYNQRNKDHRLDMQLRRSYGITRADYLALCDKNGGRCAICGTQEADRVGRRMHVDHCHATGKVRGILCRDCNIGLGHFRDNQNLLTQAAAYLARAEQPSEG